MQRFALAALVVGLMGCGVNQGDYAAQFTEAYCTWLLDCGDPAVLTFDGIHSQEDCIGLVAPEVTTYGASCKYKGGKANSCLDAMDALACTDDGSFEMPSACLDVYPGCTFGEEPPADTDTDEESG